MFARHCVCAAGCALYDAPRGFSWLAQPSYLVDGVFVAEVNLTRAFVPLIAMRYTQPSVHSRCAPANANA